jgi:hypothetical protein
MKNMARKAIVKEGRRGDPLIGIDPYRNQSERLTVKRDDFFERKYFHKKVQSNSYLDYCI